MNFAAFTFSTVCSVQLNWKCPDCVFMFGVSCVWVHWVSGGLGCVPTERSRTPYRHSAIDPAVNLLLSQTVLMICTWQSAGQCSCAMFESMSGPRWNCTFWRPWVVVLCRRIIPHANSAYRVEGVMKVIMNFGWTRKWTDLLSQHYRIRLEENCEHVSHDRRSKIESDSSLYTTLLRSVISWVKCCQPTHSFFNIHFNIISTCVLSEVACSYFVCVALWVTRVTHHVDVFTFLYPVLYSDSVGCCDSGNER